MKLNIYIANQTISMEAEKAQTFVDTLNDALKTASATRSEYRETVPFEGFSLDLKMVRKGSHESD